MKVTILISPFMPYFLCQFMFLHIQIVSSTRQRFVNLQSCNIIKDSNYRWGILSQSQLYCIENYFCYYCSLVNLLLGYFSFSQKKRKEKRCYLDWKIAKGLAAVFSILHVLHCCILCCCLMFEEC